MMRPSRTAAAPAPAARKGGLRVAILAFDGFDELDCFVPLGLIGRLKADGWSAQLTSPTAQVTSMNGVTVQAQRPLEFANEADAVLFGSGLFHRAIADPSTERGRWLDRLTLDPLRQRFGARGSGSLLLARLGLLGDAPACTDAATRPWLVQAGVLALEARFHARGPVATASGSLGALSLAAWLVADVAGLAAAEAALRGAAPGAIAEAWIDDALATIKPHLRGASAPGV